MVDGVAADLSAAGVRFGVVGREVADPDDIETEFDQHLDLVPASLAKGLEFDHVVLLEPAAIVAGEPDRVTGLRRLYVCLTRAVTSLVVAHAAAAPRRAGRRRLTARPFDVTMSEVKIEQVEGKRRYQMTARAEAAQSTADGILDAAIELFTEKAFEDVTLDEVAERAGVTKRTVLRRFVSKDQLFLTAMNHAVDEMVRQRQAAPVGDVPGAVANVVEHYERWGTNRLRLLSQEDRIGLVAEHVRGGRGVPPGLGRACLRTPAGRTPGFGTHTAGGRSGGHHRCVHLEAASPRPRPQPGRDRADAGRDDRLAERRPGMARFLAYTSPARGHLYPITPTLLELAHRGHDVHVRTLSSEVDALAASGVQAADIDPMIEAIELDDWQSPDPVEGIARIFEALAERAGYEIEDLRRAIADVRPDCLLVDITTVGAAAVAEASGLPWARWIPFLAHASFDPTPSASIDFLPYTLLPSGMDVVNGARTAVGLPALASPDDGWRAAVELYLTAEPFELPGLSYPESFRWSVRASGSRRRLRSPGWTRWQLRSSWSRRRARSKETTG